MASGRRGPVDVDEFAAALRRACEDLTLQMARDAEGVTRLVRRAWRRKAKRSRARCSVFRVRMRAQTGAPAA